MCKIVFFTALFLFVTIFCVGQSIYIGYGRADTYTKIPVPLIDGGDSNDFNNSADAKNIGFLWPYKKIDFIGQYSTYLGVVTNPYGDYDYLKDRKIFFRDMIIHRFDIGISKPILSRYARLYLDPYFCLAFQISQAGSSSRGGLLKMDGPKYFEIDAQTEKYSITQIVPVMGVQAGMKIRKKIRFGINVAYVHSFKNVLTMTTYYYHRDSPNILRETVSESTGTGIYSTFTLGLLLNKSKKKLSDVSIDPIL